METDPWVASFCFVFVFLAADRFLGLTCSFSRRGSQRSGSGGGREGSSGLAAFTLRGFVDFESRELEGGGKLGWEWKNEDVMGTASNWSTFIKPVWLGIVSSTKSIRA